MLAALPTLLVDWPTQQTVVMVPLGKVPERTLKRVEAVIQKTYRARVVRGRSHMLPKSAYYPPRKRYLADKILPWLNTMEPRGDKVVAVTTVDISTSMRGKVNWGIAGYGAIGGRPCVISTFRMKRDPSRLEPITIHEVGHTMGLHHCPDQRCVMRDAKGKIKPIRPTFCTLCRRRIQSVLR